MKRLSERLGTVGIRFLILGLAVTFISAEAFARDIDYQGTEVAVNVVPGEPTQITFPGQIQGGFKKNLSALHLDRKDSDLIVFASEGINAEGEAIIVRLKDGRSYSVRLRLADSLHPRDDVVSIDDKNISFVDEEEEKAYKERKFDYAPPSTVSGLMREMVLFAEFGKKSIPGYRVSDRYRGETVLSDGALKANVDIIFIGTNLWGYVIDAENQIDQTVKVNPATFRLDGTRAVSAKHWELAPRPLNVEQQIASKDKTKIYVITRAKRFQ
jgi:hypothetical protein